MSFAMLKFRDGNGDCAELDQARQVVERGLDILHMATAITGVKGVIVRALAAVRFTWGWTRLSHPSV